MNLSGGMEQLLAIDYQFSQSRQGQIYISRSFNEYGKKLEGSKIGLVYNHAGYQFRIPLYCYNQIENTKA